MKKIFLMCSLMIAGLSYGQQYPKNEVEAARAFVRIMQKADTSALLALLPPTSVYRLTAPEETQGKSDSEIVAMAEPLRSDLLASFRSLLREADSLQIDRNKIKFLNQKTIAVTNYPGFYGLRIFFSYGKKEGEFSLGTAFIDNSWYIYGIDQYQGVFTEVK